MHRSSNGKFITLLYSTHYSVFTNIMWQHFVPNICVNGFLYLNHFPVFDIEDTVSIDYLIWFSDIRFSSFCDSTTENIFFWNFKCCRTDFIFTLELLSKVFLKRSKNSETDSIESKIWPRKLQQEKPIQSQIKKIFCISILSFLDFSNALKGKGKFVSISDHTQSWLFSYQFLNKLLTHIS